MTLSSHELPSSLKRQLSSLARALRALRVARGVVVWIAACSLTFGALVLGLSVLSPSPAAHLYVTGALLVFGLISLSTLALVPVLEAISPRSLARLIERRFPELQDSLLAVVDPAEAEAARTSPGLAKALATQVSKRLQRESLLLAVNFRALRPLSLAALTCVLTALLIAVTCPQGLARLVNPPEAAVALPSPKGARKAAPPDLTRVGIFDISVAIEPPEYTGLARRTLTGEFERLRVVKGTRITIRARQTQGAEATLNLGDERLPLLPSESGRLAHRFVPMQDTSWRLAARLGGRRASVGPFGISVIADRRPRVRIVEPGRNMSLDELRPVKLVVAASDDFGLASVALLYRRKGETSWRSLSLGGGGPEIRASYQWDLSPMGLRPGDAVEYRALARDNDAVSGAKTVTTKTYVVSLSRPEAPEPSTPQAVEQAHELEHDALDRLRAEAQAFDRQLEELIARARAAEASGESFEFSKGALQEAQERLAQRAQDVREAMASAEKSLAENPLVSDDMIQKVQELHKLMAELMDEDLKAVMEKIEEALRQLDSREIRMSLEQAREAQREFIEKLDRTISLLRKAKLEAQLEALRRFVEQLADRQESLHERTSRLEEGERSDKDVREQERLAEQARPLSEQIRDIGEEMTAESEEIASDLRNLAADVDRQDAAGQMRQAVGAMERSKPSSARAPQARALRTLRDTAARLSGAAADLTAQDRRTLTNAARRLTRDTLKLSHSQEGVLEKARPLAAQGRPNILEQKNRLSDIKRQQDAVRRGAEGLASHMRELSRQTPMMSPELAQETQRLAASMGQAANEVEAGQVAQAFVRQSEAMAELNDLAQRLMQLADQLNEASAQMALQEYLKRLEELAQRQKSLNQQTGGAKEGGEGQKQAGGTAGGMQPVPQPGGLGQLALEQALIREALQKLLSGKGAGKLADQLGGTPAEMEKVEDDLRGHSVTPETRRRQRDILHKMLDAQRSLYSKKKESKERKAEAPKPYAPPKAPPLLRPEHSRPAQVERQRRDMGSSELPLDFEAITREYLEKVRR